MKYMNEMITQKLMRAYSGVDAWVVWDVGVRTRSPVLRVVHLAQGHVYDQVQLTARRQAG